MSTLIAGAAEGAAVLSATRTTSPPELDGMLDDSCWETAAVTDPFLTEVSMVPNLVVTVVFLTHDSTHLYVAFKCDEPATDKIQTIATGTNSKAFWKAQDDLVDFFILPDIHTDLTYQFAVTAAGVRWARSRGVEGGFVTDWQAAASIGAGVWTAEMAIPFSTIGLKPQLCRDLRLNFTRLRPLDNKSDTHFRTKTTSWAPVGLLWKDKEKWGVLEELVIEDENTVKTSGISIAKAAFPAEPTVGQNSVEIVLSNQKAKVRNVTCRIETLSPSGEQGQGDEVSLTIPSEGKKGVTLPFSLPSQSGSHRVRLHVREGMRAIYVSPWGQRVLQSLITGYLTRNMYTSEKQATLNIELNLTASQLVNHTMRGRIFDSQGSKIDQVDINALPGTSALTFPLTAIPSGEYHIIADLVDKDNNPIAEAKEPFYDDGKIILRKHPPKANEVKIDRERRILLKNGKPFFPIAITWVNGADVLIKMPPAKLFDGSGFNHVSPRLLSGPLWKYKDVIDTTKVWPGLREYMDEAHRRGWAVSNDLLHGDARGRLPKIWEELKPQFAEELPKLADHPALLYYDSADESSVTDLPVLTDIYRTLRAVDPYHPVAVIHCGEIRFPGAVDIESSDIYLNPNSQSPLRIALRVEKDVAKAKKWHVPYLPLLSASIFSGAPRHLTAQEQRAQTYLTLTKQVSGMMWWPYKHNQSASLWNEIKALSLELKHLAPILSEELPVKYDVDFALPKPVLLRLRQYKGRLYLICANSVDRKAEAQFTFEHSLADKVEVLFEERSIDSGQTTFNDTFAGYGTHVYCLGKSPDADSCSIRVVSKLLPAEKLTRRRKSLPLRGKKPNYLENSGFEVCANPDVPDYWRFGYAFLTHPDTSNDNIIADHQVAYEGYRSVSVGSSRASLNSYARKRARQPGGKPYTYSGYVKGTGPDRSLSIRLVVAGEKGTEKHAYALSGNAWQRFEFTVNPEEPFVPSMSIFVNRGEGKVWIDALQCEEGEEATHYVEDAYTKAYWDEMSISAFPK